MQGRNQLFLVADHAFYRFDLTARNVTKIVDFNGWAGDKFGSDATSGSVPLHIGRVETADAYIPMGSTGGVTPSCTLFTFSPPTLKIITTVNEGNYKNNTPCYENDKQLYGYTPLSYDSGRPAGQTIPQTIKSFSLPSDYILQAN